MADLGFAKDSSMQDGTGDPDYMGFMHDWMRAIFVSEQVLRAYNK
jgi:hypothetical protein